MAAFAVINEVFEAVRNRQLAAVDLPRASVRTLCLAAAGDEALARLPFRVIRPGLLALTATLTWALVTLVFLIGMAQQIEGYVDGYQMLKAIPIVVMGIAPAAAAATTVAMAGVVLLIVLSISVLTGNRWVQGIDNILTGLTIRLSFLPTPRHFADCEFLKVEIEETSGLRHSAIHRDEGVWKQVCTWLNNRPT